MTVTLSTTPLTALAGRASRITPQRPPRKCGRKPVLWNGLPQPLSQNTQSIAPETGRYPRSGPIDAPLNNSQAVPGDMISERQQICAP